MTDNKFELNCLDEAANYQAERRLRKEEKMRNDIKVVDSKEVLLKAGLRLGGQSEADEPRETVRFLSDPEPDSNGLAYDKHLARYPFCKKHEHKRPCHEKPCHEKPCHEKPCHKQIWPCHERPCREKHCHEKPWPCHEKPQPCHEKCCHEKSWPCHDKPKQPWPLQESTYEENLQTEKPSITSLNEETKRSKAVDSGAKKSKRTSSSIVSDTAKKLEDAIDISLNENANYNAIEILSQLKALSKNR